MNKLFYYKVTYLDSNMEEIETKGIVCAKNYADAALKLTQNYNNDNLCDLFLMDTTDDIIDMDEIEIYNKRY